MRSQVRIGINAVLLLIVAGTVGQCEEDSAVEEAKAWQTRRVAEFVAYEVLQSSPQGAVAVKFEPASALSWSNPIRKTAAGAVFLWTVGGRPQLIASAYPYPDGIEHELTSLSETPLVLIQDRVQRHHFTPNVVWKDVPDAEPPHQQRALRLVQMRRIAERFRVEGGNQKKFEARLLPQPIYRSPADATVDAAVFAFVQGTDPEAVLMIEATKKPCWRYALARMTTVPMTAVLDDAKVWELPACWDVRMEDNQPFRTIQLPGAK